MEHARARVLPSELRALYEHLQARILEIIEPSSLKLRRAEDAPETVCGGTPQPRGADEVSV